MSGIHKEFISELQFYSKGCELYINTQGKASIVADEKKVPLELNQLTAQIKILISVRVLNAELYYCSKKKWDSGQEINRRYGDHHFWFTRNR